MVRGRLIAMAQLARDSAVTWTLQPDWKFLEAALLYEDATLTSNTNGKNVLRYLKEDLGAVIDAHSHGNGGYNYTDVAHLLDSFGVGGSAVIGGHIWDPSLLQFEAWDRYRVPVAGQHYPGALWRGDILMGSGTPNHVNDPTVSGVWRPRDRDHYFEHDSTANVVAIGQYLGNVSDVEALEGLYRDGIVPLSFMLTTSLALRPSILTAPGGVEAIRDTVIAPLVALRDRGLVVLTDFTTLVNTWLGTFGGQGYLYRAAGTVAVIEAETAALLVRLWCSPNPFAQGTEIDYTLSRPARVRLEIYDLGGRRVATLADGIASAGPHAAWWNARAIANGIYLCRLEAFASGGTSAVTITRKLVRQR